MQEKLSKSQVDFGERFEQALEYAQKSRADLSREIGIAASTMSRWSGERPSMPNFNTISAVAKALGVRSSWLASGEGTMTQNDPKSLNVGEGEFAEFLASCTSAELIQLIRSELSRGIEGAIAPRSWALEAVDELHQRSHDEPKPDDD